MFRRHRLYSSPTTISHSEGRFLLIPTITVTNPLGQVFVMQSGGRGDKDQFLNHNNTDSSCAIMDSSSNTYCSQIERRLTCKALASLILAIVVVSLPLLCLRHHHPQQQKMIEKGFVVLFTPRIAA